MGSPVGHCAASMEAMRTGARSNTYHNPMAISQILPALHQKSYLAVKTKNCLEEDGMCSVVSPPCGHFRWCQAVSSWLCRVSSCLRLLSVGARWAWGGSAKWDQSDSDRGGGDVEWSSFSLPCGCAKGQHSVGGPGNPHGEKHQLHVSLYNANLMYFI